MKLLLLLTFSVLAFAQTKIHSQQIIVCPANTAPTVLMLSATGSIQCVQIDNVTIQLNTAGQLSAKPSGTSPTFVDQTPLTGTLDGSNPNFVLSGTPNPVSSVAVYRNGILYKAGVDYTIAGSTVIFVVAQIPQPGDILLASFRQ